MIVKNQAVTIQYSAWDSVNGAWKTGDVGNHTMRIVRDGVSYVPTNTPTEVSAANVPGVYSLALTAGETNGYFLIIDGKSSTAGVLIVPYETGIYLKSSGGKSMFDSFESPLLQGVLAQ